MYSLTRYKCMLVQDGTTTVARKAIRHAQDAAEVFFGLLAGLPHEEIHVLYLNAKSDVLGSEMVAKGGMHGCAITAKDVLRGALLANASAIILAHNHPSGDPTPSAEDILVTKTIKLAGECVGLDVLDHLVVCPETRTFRSIDELC